MKKKKSYCKKMKKEVGYDCEDNIFTIKGAKKAAEKKAGMIKILKDKY